MEAVLDTIEQRLAEVTRLESVLAAEKLRLIRRADIAQANLADGARTMAEWAARHLDEDPRRTRQLVRAARSMSEEVAHRLDAGEISVARAEAYAEAELRSIDTSELDGFDIAGIRRLVKKAEPLSPNPDERFLAMQPTLDGTAWSVWGRLGATDGAIVHDALVAQADLVDDGVPNEHRTPRQERMADALVTLALGEADITPTVAIHLDADAHPEVDSVSAQLGELSAALCLGEVTVDRIEQGTPMAYGTTTRHIPVRLRTFIHHRDGFTCSIDGCTSSYRTEPHHILHAASSGPTDADNLTLLCWFHHHIVIHTRGFEVDPDSPEQRRRLIPPEH